MASRSEKKSPNGFFVGSANQVLDQILFRIDDGQHESAENILRQLIKNRPGHAEAWNLRGVNAIKGGGIELAIECFTKASNINRNNPVYAANLGNSLGLDKRWEQAAGAWSRAILLSPKNPEHQLGLAACLMHTGKILEALKHGDRALQMDPTPEAIFTFARSLSEHGQLEPAINAYTVGLTRQPKNAEAEYQLGLLFQKLGKFKKADACFRSIISRDSDNAEALCRLSVTARELGFTEDAIQAGERALALKSDFPEAHNNLGLALCDSKEFVKAIVHFQKALASTKTPYEILNNLGVTHQALGNLSEAEDFLRRACAIESSLPAAERNLGNILRQTERFDEALIYYRRALEKSPIDFTNYANLGLLLLNLNRPLDAITVYEKALSLKPDHFSIRKSLGIAHLMSGNFREGFLNYEARLAEKSFSSKLPKWSPGCNASSVLVIAEQGFGDTLQFCRYLRQLVEMGLKVTFVCQSPLVRLMKSIDPAIVVISETEQTPIADSHIPLLSLPHALDNTLETIPKHCPYLKVNETLTSTQNQISNKFSKNVGLVWSGNPLRQDDRMRSCPPELIKRILNVAGFDFYSLQKEGVPDCLKELTDLGSNVKDFAETAAVIEPFDIIITVDTAMAHLAGSLAKPVWVMLSYSADWRYLIDREDSPWYPQMRLFRQKKPGAWVDLVTEVAEALSKWESP